MLVKYRAYLKNQTNQPKPRVKHRDTVITIADSAACYGMKGSIWDLAEGTQRNVWRTLSLVCDASTWQPW